MAKLVNKARHLDVYLDEHFEGTMEEAIERSDEIIVALQELFDYVSVSIGYPAKDAKGNRPKGWELSVSASGHSSDVARQWDDADTMPVAVEPGTDIVDVLTTPVPLHG